MFTISVVIPAKNEETEIRKTLHSVRKHIPPDLLSEIIVIDNGSTDATGQVARGFGAIVLPQSEGHIGSLRNRGASRATGDLLVFLDADVSLASDWDRGLIHLQHKTLENPNLITGAWCEIPEQDSWIPRLWHSDTDKRGSVTHIGSGHMIVPRATFDRIGGFDESLGTGEDYDLCQRALEEGIPVIAIPEFRAFHRGEPQVLTAFFRRELWHGMGDGGSMAKILRSNIALASLAVASLHGLLILPLISRGAVPWPVAFVGIGLIFSGVLGAVTVRWGWRSPVRLPARLLLTYLYFWARFAALIRAQFLQHSADSPRKSRSRTHADPP